MAKRRRVKGATQQRKITLPVHVWELLESVAKLYSAAYTAHGGKTSFTVSDLLEAGAEMFLLSLREDFGPLPDDDTPKSEREAWVKRLAERVRKDILDDFWAKKPH